MKTPELIIDDETNKRLRNWTMKALGHPKSCGYIHILQVLISGINVIVYEERGAGKQEFPDWPVGRKYFTWSELKSLSKVSNNKKGEK